MTSRIEVYEAVAEMEPNSWMTAKEVAHYMGRPEQHDGIGACLSSLARAELVQQQRGKRPYKYARLDAPPSSEEAHRTLARNERGHREMAARKRFSDIDTCMELMEALEKRVGALERDNEMLRLLVKTMVAQPTSPQPSAPGNDFDFVASMDWLINGGKGDA